MGAWGTGPFDNDDASDWLYELQESSDESAIVIALEAVAGTGGYLEAPECSTALAAAEIAAALQGTPLDGLPDEAKSWIDENRLRLNVPGLIPLSIVAVERIRTNSELKELWEESGDADQWHSELANLTLRLQKGETSPISQSRE